MTNFLNFNPAIRLRKILLNKVIPLYLIHIIIIFRKFYAQTNSFKINSIIEITMKYLRNVLLNYTLLHLA